jgi:arthrofactin-type cyclic lipopeptide synthetase B
VVLAREDEPGDMRLVAYYATDGTEVPVEALKAHLVRTLASYMVPAAYVQLAALPLTPNGKLDRRALPVPEFGANSTREYAPAQGETEAVLAEIWRDLLRVERVGRHDNFFELGGHSLLAIRVLERMRREGLQVDVRTLFLTPTLSELARVAGQEGEEAEVPPNRITAECNRITPELLPLAQLSQEEIDRVVGVCATYRTSTRCRRCRRGSCSIT